MFRFCLAIGLLCCLVLCIGCTSPPKGAAPATKVSGIVNMDGKPIPTGEIQFTVVGYPPIVLEIKDGNYAGEAGIGKNHVEVFVYKEGPVVGKYGKRDKQNTTLEKYTGLNTVLEANVEVGAANEFKFDLVSK